MRRRWTDEEIDSLGAEPRAGEVWWCDGGAIGLNDGAKTRPVLVLGFATGEARVIPLTSQKPEGHATSVAHRGGLSWMAGGSGVRTVSRVALISNLGAWPGYAAWRRRARGI